MAYAGISSVERRGGLYRGEQRAPANIAAARAGSIHDDTRAMSLGFKGGPVSGLVHNEQFVPIALAMFGPTWFERGSYSMYYRTPTLHGEPVRAFARDPGELARDTQVEAWSENAGGERVADGTLGFGSPAEPSALRLQLARPRPAGELRILRGARVGEALGEPRRVRVSLETQLRTRGQMTEPLEWFFGDSPWGGPIAASLGLYRLLRVPAASSIAGSPGVQIDGAIEVRYVNGPVFVERDYEVSALTLAVGQTPRTEYLWFESTLREPGDGAVVAQKLMMCRWMKKSSPLYQET